MSHRPCAPFLSLPLSLIVCGFLHAQGGLTASPLPAQETDGLVERIRREEYRFEVVKKEQATWSAPNRAQGLRSRVSERGLEVFPRATGADGERALWKLELATTSIGRTDGSFDLPRASVSIAGERVELDHGFLVEWFVNDERGIEQGWTIHERLIGSEPLAIGLAIEGELSLRIEEGGRSGVLVDACGEAVLRYRDLVAFDATGRELDARIVPTPVGVSIEVDDSAAAYPLTVDPLLTAPAWTAESNQADATFGRSVSTAGDVNGDGYSDVIVGANGFDNGQFNEGRAFVYLGAPGGLAADAAWTAEPDQEQASFGSSVCSAGDVNGDGYSDVIVAMTPNLPELEERVYVYHGSSSGLAANPAWIGTAPPIGTSLESFADAVASAGDVNSDGYDDVIIGIPAHSNGQFSEGAACVFHGSPSGLSTSAIGPPSPTNPRPSSAPRSRLRAT